MEDAGPSISDKLDQPTKDSQRSPQVVPSIYIKFFQGRKRNQGGDWGREREKDGDTKQITWSLAVKSRYMDLCNRPGAVSAQTVSTSDFGSTGLRGVSGGSLTGRSGIEVVSCSSNIRRRVCLPLQSSDTSQRYQALCSSGHAPLRHGPSSTILISSASQEVQTK